MKTVVKNFYQNRAPRELEPGNVYPFHVAYVHFDEKKGMLNIVFSLKNEKTGRSHYLLDTFKVDSERYWALIRKVYSDELSWGMVIAIDYEDLTRFWGECALIFEDGRLVVDLDLIEVDSAPFSHLWEEQCKGVGFWECNYQPKTYQFESVEASNPAYRKSSFYAQPNISSKLKLGERYDFRVRRVFAKTRDTLQFVIALTDTAGEGHYILDELEVNSERFDLFVTHAYSVDVDSGMVVEFIGDDLCDVFSGVCELEEHNGKLRINWQNIELDETLMSPIFDEQVSAQKGGEF